MVSVESAAAPTTVGESEPTPLQVFIVKTQSRCNIACTHCYMYEFADQGWRNQPTRMSYETVDATAERVAEHMGAHALSDVLVVYHGGEPWMTERADPNFYPRANARFLEAAKRAVGEHANVKFGMQTNGMLITRPVLDKFNDLGIRLGVSLNGTKETNDKIRKYKDGRGTYDEAAAGLRLLQEYPDIYGTLLCVIDPDSDLVEAYHSLAAFKPPAIEFIWPLAHWSSLPPGYSQYTPGLRSPDSILQMPPPASTRYADRLLPLFNEWCTNPELPDIPLFREVTGLYMGKKGSLEYIGPATPNVITVETDGGIEDIDTLKATTDGRTDLGLDVYNNSFDDALAHPKVRARQLGSVLLADQCRSCPVVDICRGGYFVHRYRQAADGRTPADPAAEFMNPSVYCMDLKKLLMEAGIRIGYDLAV